MRPETIRRLLVMGVCAAGVVALYRFPSTSGTLLPQGVDARDRAPEADGQVVDVADPSHTIRSGAGGDGLRGQCGNSAGNALPIAAASRAAGPNRTVRGRDAQRHTARSGDATSPTPVTALRSEARRDRLVVHWAPAHDDLAVSGYLVELNGYEVAETAQLSVSVPWFNGAPGHSVVRVRARDEAGNLSTPTALLVERPPAADGPRSVPAPVDRSSPPPDAPAGAQSPTDSTTAATAPPIASSAPDASPRPSPPVESPSVPLAPAGAVPPDPEVPHS